MAMLTFLRIGKEVHDETEEYIINHLLFRQQTVCQRLFAACGRSFSRLIARIFSLFGIDGLI